MTDGRVVCHDTEWMDGWCIMTQDGWTVCHDSVLSLVCLVMHAPYLILNFALARRTPGRIYARTDVRPAGCVSFLSDSLFQLFPLNDKSW